jgi:hypothetical protein
MATDWGQSKTGLKLAPFSADPEFRAAKVVGDRDEILRPSVAFS